MRRVKCGKLMESWNIFVTHKHKNIFSHHFPTLDDDFVPKSEDAGIFFWGKFPSHNKTQPLYFIPQNRTFGNTQFLPKPPKTTSVLFPFPKGVIAKKRKFLQHWFMKKNQTRTKNILQAKFSRKHVLSVQSVVFFFWWGIGMGKIPTFKRETV